MSFIKNLGKALIGSNPLTKGIFEGIKNRFNDFKKLLSGEMGIGKFLLKGITASPAFAGLRNLQTLLQVTQNQPAPQPAQQNAQAK